MFTIFHAHNFFQHLRLALWLLQRWLSGKKSICSAGDSGSIPGSGRSPEEEMATHSQYSCRENPTDRGGWWATVRGVGKSWTWLRDWTYTQTCCRQCFSYCLEYIFSSFFFFNEDLLLVTAGFYISGNVFISSSFLKGSSDSVQFLVGSNYLSTP